MEVRIFTDGSSLGNPGPGGFGIVMLFGTRRKEISKGFKKTTNNRMELMAVLVALELLKSNKYNIHIFSDSKYVIDSISKGWVYNWQKKNFKGKKNKDLWLKYLRVAKGFNVRYTWVKGHAGNIENERCDVMAVQAAETGPWVEDEGYEQENSSGMFD